MKYIEQESPDILCLQEVFSSKVDPDLFDFLQTHEKVDQLYKYNIYLPMFSFDTFGKQVIYGMAIYSKYPIVKHSSLFTAGGYKKHFNLENYNDNVPALLCATLALPDQEITIANHHGYWSSHSSGSNKSVDSMKKVTDILKDVKTPLIFCGDFNVDPSSSAMAQLNDLNLVNLTTQSNIKSTLSSIHYAQKDVVCDYILASKELVVSNFKCRT